MITGLHLLSRRNYSAVNRLFAVRQIVLLGMCALLFSNAHAVKQGHGRLVSSPGSPLEIVLPITALSAEDQKELKVEVAQPSLWTQSGLTPPVSLDSMRVVLNPGSSPSTRNIVVKSTQPSNQSVVDVLLTLSSASGTRPLQLSLLQPEFARVELAVNPATIKIQAGDTLYAIAQRNLVPGATIHQMLWALYEANPGAFISSNMNLMRAGAVLNIPDAKSVLAVDPLVARSRFAEHDARFRSMRGQRGSAAGQPPVLGSASASSGKLSQQVKPTSGEQSAEDRLRLSTSDKDREADLQASRKREIEENQARVGELQQNIQQMKDSLGQVDASSSGLRAEEQARNATAAQTGVTGSIGTSASPSAQQAPQPVAQQKASESEQKEVSVITHWLKDNLLVVMTALLALVAFLIGMRMRRHSSRRDDEGDDPDVAEQMSPAVKSAFEKKLQSIDLNLDSTDTPATDAKKASQS